jgi:dihydrolipoamide dehydrogenase
MSDLQQANALIIGSGQGGVPLAKQWAREGKEVVLFERQHWGGCCVNYGCTPSKMLLASAHAAGRARQAEILGVKAQVTVNFPEVMGRIRESVDSSRKGVREGLAEAGVDLVETEARFVGEGRLAAGDRVYEAPIIVINTGKSPVIPPIDGLDQVQFDTYETLWAWETLPESLVIVGGGYVGVEIGQAMARLGSRVSMVEVHDRLVSGEDPEVSRALQESLKADGVRLYLNARAESVQKQSGRIRVDLSTNEIIEGSKLLIAVGRKPNTAALQPEQGGVELHEKGHVEVSDTFQTSAEGVYAIGDVTGQPAFTHVSWEDHRRLYQILNGENREQGDRPLAYAFFTDPQVGRVGLSARGARDAGYDPETVTLDLEKVARARETAQTLGYYWMVVDRGSDQILGATLVGPTAAELIHIFIAHIQAGSTWQVLERSVHIHPTFAEGLPSLARQLTQ